MVRKKMLLQGMVGMRKKRPPDTANNKDE